LHSLLANALQRASLRPPSAMQQSNGATAVKLR